MPYKNYILLVLLLPGIFLYSCGSSGAYDIIEVEEDTPPQSIKQTKPVEVTRTETKENISEYKKTSTSRYSIQLGAFEVEDNARNYIKLIKDRLGYDVSYGIYQGLYKIKYGDFSSPSEAMVILGKIQDAGFGDSFITEQIK